MALIAVRENVLLDDAATKLLAVDPVLLAALLHQGPAEAITLLFPPKPPAPAAEGATAAK